MSDRIPRCIYEPEYGMFRVILSKGKSLSNGGYGVTTSSPSTVFCQHSNNNNEIKKQETTSNQQPQSQPQDYLFIEEALFLHERGLIQVLKSSSQSLLLQPRNDSSSSPPLEQILDTKDLYTIMLHHLQIPLQVYLTYAHLRSQTFIVLRHSKNRISILQNIMHSSSSSTTTNATNLYKNTNNNNNNNTVKGLKLALRNDACLAPVPRLLSLNDTTNHTLKHNNSNHATTDTATDTNININIYNHIYHDIAFQVYNPNSNFRKTDPGLPDMLVAITNFSESSPTFNHLTSLIKYCDGIPLRLAAVSNSGTVIMFALTDFGPPNLVCH